MSKTVTPSSLKWLINKRARLMGQIDRIETLKPIIASSAQIIEDAQEKLQLLIKSHQEYLNDQDKLPVLRKRLEAIDIALDMHDIQINKDYIQPIRARATLSTLLNSPQFQLRYGEITRCIYECLRLTQRPNSTGEIALFIIHKRGWESNRSELLPLVTEKVGKRIHAMRDQGKILRMHKPKPGKQGIWALPPA